MTTIARDFPMGSYLLVGAKEAFWWRAHAWFASGSGVVYGTGRLNFRGVLVVGDISRWRGTISPGVRVASKGGLA